MKHPDALWHDLVYRFAGQSRCRTRHVGAILVDSSGHVIGQGWNSAPSGSECRDCRRCNHGAVSGTALGAAICTHAEANAIGHCAMAGIATAGTTLICTTRPCAECAKLIIAAGVTFVRYFEEYPSTDDALDMLSRAGVSVLAGALLEEETRK